MKASVKNVVVLFVVFMGQLGSPFIIRAQTDEKQALLELRDSLPSAFGEEATCSKLYTKYNKVKSTDPLLNGYIGGLFIARSKHAAIVDKPSAFRTGRGMLEEAISQKPDNVELKFLRLTIQINLPSFLGYDDNIDSDKKFVIEHYQKAPLVLRPRIINFVKESDAFTDDEKARVN